jgi:hypothetical protein
MGLLSTVLTAWVFEKVCSRAGAESLQKQAAFFVPCHKRFLFAKDAG